MQPGESPDVIRAQAERVGIDDRRFGQHARATLTSARKPRAVMTDVAREGERTRRHPCDVDVFEPTSRLAHRLELKSLTGGDVSGLDVIQPPDRQIIHESRSADIPGHVHPAQAYRECPYRLDSNVGAHVRAASVFGKANRARNRLPARLQTIDLALRERKGTPVSIKLAGDIVGKAIPSARNGEAILPPHGIAQLWAQPRRQRNDGILRAAARGDCEQRAFAVAQQRVGIARIKATYELRQTIGWRARPDFSIPAPLWRARVALPRLHEQHAVRCSRTVPDALRRRQHLDGLDVVGIDLLEPQRAAE